ncbi:hypothetical protein AGLY_002269 [Aphis glycines]|uniref:ATP-dependent DNA helicase n=1 Tax=Aphis glycines TaxID=307491 RepID=A0A6G0U4B9_APHGL|nr:hypothetical protein AGLY_002269 [Aphis glycines]
MLHDVQNSPSYLAAMRKNVFAIVRQEDQPTLFLTSSPSESTWTDLLKILYKLRYSKTLLNDTVLTYAQKSDLIRQDPVVCATYFDHRFRALLKLIKSKNVIFKEHSVKHFFYRVEYQHKSSPHVHMLLWLDNTPVFDPAIPETFSACVTLINKYITHPDKRTRMLKPMAVRGEMDPKSDDIFFTVSMKTIHVDHTVLKISDSDTDNEPDTTYPIDSTLIGKPNKYIHKRKIRKIIRYVRFNVDKNEQDFYREKIMLFLPWRNEKTDLLDINCKQVYETNIDQIKMLYQQFNKVVETQLDDNEIQIEGEQGHVESLKDGGKIIVHLKDNEQFKDLIGCLNDGQRQLVYHTTNVIRSQLWGKGHPAMKVFVTGLAEVEKPDIDELSLPPILLTAPTGKAAYGIKGLTLHSKFKLPLNQFAGFLPMLSSDISNTLRCQFANVKLLIIDEIFMVVIKTLGYIDQLLRSILRINKPFGNINIIVFGDFFQLAPVLATPLYDSFEEILSKFPSAVEKISIKSIWETFKFYELTEIMRQKDDKQFAIMLTKLARGQLEEANLKYFQNPITHLYITF